MKITIPIILIILVSIYTFAEEPNDVINPLEPGVDDFLDTDLAILARNAATAYDSGDFEEAARSYLEWLQYDIGDAGALYNLACCYGLLGYADGAATNLVRSVRAGYTDFEWIEEDSDFDDVRETEVFITAMATIAEHLKARHEGTGDMLYFQGNSLFRGRVNLPENYDPAKSYKLLVGMHGYGGHPDTFARKWTQFTTPDFIYVSLQAPYPVSFGGAVFYSWILGTGKDEENHDLSYALASDYVADSIRDLKKQYNVSEVYLMGFSQGGMMCYATAVRNPGLVDGIVPIGGMLMDDIITDEQIMAAKDVRVYIIHGTDDKSVEYFEAEKAEAILIGSGYDVEFYSFIGGHTIPSEALPIMQEWMAK